MIVNDTPHSEQIPASWVGCLLEDIAETTSGGTPDRKRVDFYGGGIPWVKSGELNDSYIVKTEESLSPEGLKQSSAKLFPTGTLLMAMYGATVGKTAILRMEAATNQAVCGIFPHEEKADTDFLRYFLIGERQELLKQRYGGAQPNISQNVIRNFPVRLPPVAEQRKIAQVLRTVQRAIEQQERMLALTSELKKTILHQLFTHGFRSELQKETNIGPVPQSWEVLRLGDVAKLQSGGTPARDTPEYWTAGDTPWVKTGEIDYRVIDNTEEMITREGLANSAAKVFPKGTLLMAMYGQGVTRGRVAVLGIEAATNQACAAITPRDEQRVSTRFIYYYLQFHYEDLRQMGHGANQRNLNAALIKGFPLSFPTPDEQLRIIEVIEALDTKMTLHQSKHTALTALFRTLLHQLMTAQIRVNDLNITILQTYSMEWPHAKKQT